MTFPSSLGSLGLPAQLQRAGRQLRTDLQRHSIEMVTERAANPARHLRGDLGALSVIETRLTRISAEDASLRSAATAFQTAQSALDRIAQSGEAVWRQILTVSDREPGNESLLTAGHAARAGLDDMVSALSVRAAGQAVFSGTAPDRAPLVSAGNMMAAIAGLVAGAGSASEVVQLVDDAFNAPGGLFETQFYAGAAPVQAGSLTALPTAMDPAIRAALGNAVLGALLAETDILSDPRLRRDLATELAARHPAGAERLTTLRAGVGDAEAHVDAARLGLSAERDALVRGRFDLIGVDPFEAASRLEETRARLESLYVITARVARMSLTEYLR